MESSKVFEKIKKVSKTQKCPTSFLKLSKLVLNMFCGIFFGKKVFSHCSMEGGVFEKFQKISKKIQNSINAQNRSQQCANVFWTCFGAIFFEKKVFTQCSMQGFSDFLDLKIWVQFSGLKNKSQFYDTILNRYSLCIHATVNIRNPISDFLDLKIWVQIPQFKNKGLVFRT